MQAKVDSVCGSAATRYLRDICETVCEELARLATCEPGEEGRAAAFQARLEYRLLHAAAHSHLTRKAEDHLMEAMACVPPLESDEDKKRLEVLVNTFTKRMKLQLTSLNSNVEIV